MIKSTRILVTDQTNPHINLALEDALLKSLPEGQALLFLWQNKHTVVIGAGQNAWRECHIERMKQEGATLARRSSGGGAVYHDLGNLNFSFIVPREDYDVARQLGVVMRAVKSLGIPCEASGRNDITASGRKFSGNAFRLLREGALHHGTVMVSVDMGILPRYLNVSPDKLKAKGVKSVPSRVVNLSELGTVTVETMKQAMIDAFRSEYGQAPVERAEAEKAEGMDALNDKYASWDWNYGASPAGDVEMCTRFPWGGVELYANIMGGFATGVRVFTDSMDETLKERLETALEGCPWRGDALLERASAIGENDIGLWLKDV